VPYETTTTGPTYVSVWGIAQNGHVTIGGTDQTCKSSNQNPCVQTPIPAQRVFSGSLDLSGYINTVTVSNVGSDPYNRNQCSSNCSVTMSVTVRFQSITAAPNKNDPIYFLHLGTSQNSQTLDCGTGNTRTQISQGCTSPFRRWVPPPGGDPLCSTISSYSQMATPYPCVNAQPGKGVGQVGQGMQDRVLGGLNTCPDQFRNHWTQYPWTSNPSVPQTDNRLLPVFLTKFGAFTNLPSGTNNYVPVIGFALFYVTGWSAQGNNGDPCTKGTPPAGATVDDSPADPDTIAGHFVSLIDPKIVQMPGTTPCDLSKPQLTICVPVLVD
jgi:hypothetical protein